MENVAIDKIEPNDYNPNEMTEAEFEECKKEIQHLGTLPKPIVVRPLNEKFVIVDGEHNWRAAKELGFTKVPCEIMEMGDLEAMRQTYKRNMHGAFNPVKLGAMFRRALDKTGLSQRELAKQYEVSEGTIRNALMYCEAKKLRNSYAFEKLSIRQIRLYLSLPPVIRDKWLDAGADSRLLVPEKDIRNWELNTGRRFDKTAWEDFEKSIKEITWNPEASYFHRFNEIYEAGMAEWVKGDKRQFRTSIDRIQEFLKWEYFSYCHQDKELQAKVRPYTILMFDYFDDKTYGQALKSAFAHCFKLVRFNGDFVITPDEYKQIFQESFTYGLDGGRQYQIPQFEYIHNMLQLRLIAKGIIQTPVDVDQLPDPSEELMKITFDKKAPDYIKNSILPFKVKFMVFDLAYSAGAVSDNKLDQAKREVVDILVKEYKQAQEKAAADKEKWRNFMQLNNDEVLNSTINPDSYFNVTPEYVRELVGKRLFVMQDKEKIARLTNENLAAAIIGITNLYKTEFERGLRLEFYQKLLKLKREELLAIYYVMDYNNYRRQMDAAIKGYKKGLGGR